MPPVSGSDFPVSFFLGPTGNVAVDFDELKG